MVLRRVEWGDFISHHRSLSTSRDACSTRSTRQWNAMVLSLPSLVHDSRSLLEMSFKLVKMNELIKMKITTAICIFFMTSSTGCSLPCSHASCRHHITTALVSHCLSIANARTTLVHILCRRFVRVVFANGPCPGGADATAPATTHALASVGAWRRSVRRVLVTRPRPFALQVRSRLVQPRFVSNNSIGQWRYDCSHEARSKWAHVVHRSAASRPGD